MGGREQSAAVVSRRTLGAAACVVVAMALLSVQDYFDLWSLYFTAPYILLIAGALLLIFLAPVNPRREGEEAAPQAPMRSRRVVAAVSAAWTVGCAVLSFNPQVHGPVLIGAVVLGGGVLSALLLVLRRGTMPAAALPAVASYILMISSPVLYMEHQMYPYRGTLFEVVIMGSYLAAAAPALVRMPAWTALILYLAAGTALRALGVYQWENDPAHRDMIPLIHHGAASFLEGRNPYRLYNCDHELPLTYLPLMWLSYVPAVLAGIEPRVISIILSIVAVLLIYLWKGRSRGYEDFVLYLCAVWFFQMEEMWVAIFSESAPYWVLAFFFLWAVRRERRAAAAIFLGLMLAVRHFSLLFVPYAFVWMLAGRESGTAPAAVGRKFNPGRLVYPLLSIAIPCLILLPFVYGNARAFFFGTFHWLTSFGTTHRTWWDIQISFAPLFYATRDENMLPWIQAATFLAVFTAGMAVAARRRLSAPVLRAGLWPFLAIGYIVFLLFNTLLWRYLHLMGIALLIFSILARELPGAPSKAPSGFEGFFSRVFVAGRLRAAALALLLVVIMASGAVLGRGLYGVLAKGWAVKDAQAVAKELRPGDLLVDYVYFNAWPVLEGSPFHQASLPQDVMHSLRLRSQVPALFKRVVIVSSGKQFVVPDDIRDLLGYAVPGPPHRVGSLRVYVFDNPLAGTFTAKLSEHMDWIQAVSVRAGGKRIEAERVEEGFTFPDLDPRYNLDAGTQYTLLTDRPCVLASPPPAATLRVDVRLPFDARLWLQTALPDFSLWPGFPPVDVKVSLGGRKVSASHPNDQGLYLWHLGRVAKDEPVSLFISSERKKKLRFFCFDLLTTEP